MELLPLWSALLLGAFHTFETDHLAAVGALVARRPKPAAALVHGVRWAAGHGGVVLLAGSLLLFFGVQVPETAGVWLERIVGASLVLLGAWVVISVRHLHGHRHSHPGAPASEHLHLHAHRGTHDRAGDREHPHAATAMGALHGLAGTAPVVALFPLAQGASPISGSLFLLAFAVGTAISMGLYAVIAGALAGRYALRSEVAARWIARAAGVGTAVVGAWWMLGAG